MTVELRRPIRRKATNIPLKKIIFYLNSCEEDLENKRKIRKMSEDEIQRAKLQINDIIIKN